MSFTFGGLDDDDGSWAAEQGAGHIRGVSSAGLGLIGHDDYLSVAAELGTGSHRRMVSGEAGEDQR